MKSTSVCVDFIKRFISIKKFKLPDKLAMLALVWNVLLSLSTQSYSEYAGYCLNLDYSVPKVQLDIIYFQVGGFFNIFNVRSTFSLACRMEV